jgi:hypothetical protein
MDKNAKTGPVAEREKNCFGMGLNRWLIDFFGWDYEF